MEPYCGRCVLLSRVLYGTTGACISGAARLSLGKLRVELVDNCGRLRHILFEYIPMLHESRSPNLLVVFLSWQLIGFVK